MSEEHRASGVRHRASGVRNRESGQDSTPYSLANEAAGSEAEFGTNSGARRPTPDASHSAIPHPHFEIRNPKSEIHTPLAVYVHSPFCPSKCGYCDFNSYAMRGDILERTSRAIAEEVRRSPWRGRLAKTIFFGGGTPTFFSEEQLLRIFEAVLDAHPPVEGCEITSEANPGTADVAKFRAMRKAGFNRISLGAQSFDDRELIRLERVHKADEIDRAVGIAREAGFENLNLDLMFALPGQSLERWSANLERAIALGPEHLSLYCLTLEPNTKFYKQHLRGTLVVPDDDAQVEMYDAAVSMAERSGYTQYEISNFAKPGFECRHNLCYWRGEEYLGYGPGAVGCADFGFRISDCGLSERPETPRKHDSVLPHPPSPIPHTNPRTRYTNLKHPERYCAAVEGAAPLWCESETLDETTLRLERIMLGIRLNEGLPTDGLHIPHPTYDILRTRGWIEVHGERLKLTPEGRHWCSEVALALA